MYASTSQGDFPADLYDYYRALEGKPRAELFERINDRRYDRLLDELGRLSRGRDLLDVGCGIGQWVDAATRRGWNAEGLELAEGAVNVARSLGLRVRRLPIESSTLAAETFDVVTLFEVVEHVAAPRAFLSRAAELVRRGGTLLMTVPNLRSIDRAIAGNDWAVIHPEHFTYFTPSTARALIRSTGLLEILRLQTHNVSPSLIAARARRAVGRSGSESSTATASDQAFRGKIENSASLGLLKYVVNRALDIAGVGSAMTIWCRRTE